MYCHSVFAIDFFDTEDKDVIWKTSLNQYIKYAKQDNKKYGLNDHPVELNAIDIRNAIEALEYNDSGVLGLTDELKGIFTIKQVQILGEHLATGLAEATPEQDIIFVLVKTENKILGLKERSFVAGRVFYKDNRLNIIIGDYEFFRSEAFEKAYDPSGNAAVPYNFNFGSRKRPSKAFESSAMVDIPGIANKQTDEFRYDWFVIDVKIAADAYIARKEGKKNPEGTVDSKTLDLEAAKMARERRLMRAEMARMRKEMQENNNGGGSVKSIEERIATLDQLLDKKLITQDEYDSKREAILNDI